MIKRWWKSPKVRQVRHRVSDQQVRLFPLFCMTVRLWCRLIHKNVIYDRHGPLFEFIREKRPCIIALWHQDVFPLMFELFRYTPSYPSMFMVSPGRIGTIGTRLLNMYGIDCIAGSRAREGREAVTQLSGEATASGASVFVMADGSRGPARVARWGAVRLARNTGYPIIAARAWGDNLATLENTWMKLVLPKPWGRAVIMSDGPLFVPRTDDKDALNRCREELEQSLNGLVRSTAAYFHGAPRAFAEPTLAKERPHFNERHEKGEGLQGR
jgi:lysophospholipid acyltransferase (LPLAT)-like uncharacterized protein